MAYIPITAELRGALSLTDQLEQLARHHGVLGVMVAMVVENLVIVVPSLVLLPLAGYGASLGWYPLPIVLVATVAGSLVGCLIWYGLGALVNERRLERLVRFRGRWLGLTPSRLRLSRRWFRRHGWQVVCWARLVPVLRTNVSLPAGIEMMPLAPFLGWSAIGTAIWNGLFVGLGYAFGPSLG